MSGPPVSTVRRAGVAAGGAAAVVGAQAGVALFSLWLFSRSLDGSLPDVVVWGPLLAFSLGLVWLAAVFRQDASTGLEWLGPLLVAAAPFTAFGGGCHGSASVSSLALRLSGVRIAIDSGGCSTYLNGALLVVGATLLAVGLWESLDT
jgi:hypothetical protein